MPSSPPVDDPYLWLEEIESNDVAAWVGAQNSRTLTSLCDADFYHDYGLLKEALEHDQNIPFVTRAGNNVYNLLQNSDARRGVLRRTTFEDYTLGNPTWELVLDLDRLSDKEGESWFWRGIIANGKEHDRVLFCLSRGGSDSLVYREYDLRDCDFVRGASFTLPNNATHVNWHDENSVIFTLSIHENSASERPVHKVYRLNRGDSCDAAICMYCAERDITDLTVSVIDCVGESVIITKEFVVNQYYRYVCIKSNFNSYSLPLPRNGFVYFSSSIFLVKLDHDEVLNGIEFHSGEIIYGKIEDVLIDGQATCKRIDIEHDSDIFGITTLASTIVFTAGKLFPILVYVISCNSEGEEVCVQNTHVAGTGNSVTIWPVFANKTVCDSYFIHESSIISPPRILLGERCRQVKLLYEGAYLFDSAKFRVTHETTISSDGARVPYTLVRPISRPSSRPMPVIMYGYGGFGVALTPTYLGPFGKILEKYGIGWAICHVRGGGELGPKWHVAGIRENKWLSHSDFAAVAVDLSSKKIADPTTLGAVGASNGGLLIGNMLTRFSKHFVGLWCTVPILDLRRYSSLGKGWKWIGEYGDPENDDEWKYLKKISPYHNISKTKVYKPLLIVTSRGDDRVHPAHGRKMAARLDEKDKTVFFYEQGEGGHEMSDKSQAAFMTALGIAFFRRVLSEQEHR